MERCGHCGRSIPGLRCRRGKGRCYCNYRCSHAAGDRTNCDRWDCPCTAYSKLFRVTRGILEGQEILRGALRDLGANPEMDYDKIDEDELNVPYNVNMHVDIADDDGGEADADSMDPDRERRDAELRREFGAELRREIGAQVRREIGANAAAEAADRAAFVEVAKEMALHNQNNQNNQNKRRRLDNSSDPADMRLQLEQKSKECEEMRLQLEEERLQRVEERQQRDDMRRQMEDMRLELEELRSGRST